MSMQMFRGKRTKRFIKAITFSKTSKHFIKELTLGNSYRFFLPSFSDSRILSLFPLSYNEKKLSVKLLKSLCQERGLYLSNL